jgi:hypothetical protein
MRRIDLITQACDPKTLTVGQLMQDALFTCTAQTDALLGACPTLTVRLRQTIHDHLRRSRPEKILNVFQRIRFRFFQACGLASGRAFFASLRRPCRTGS